MAGKLERRRPVVPEDSYELVRVRDPRVSPDGRLVAWVQTQADRERDLNVDSIWLAALDGSEAPRAFTRGAAAQSPRWSPDSRELGFVSDRGNGNQLFVAPLAGGDARALTKEKGSPSSPQWSPDGRSIAFVRAVGPRRGKEPLERNAPRVVRDLYNKFDGFGPFDARRRHLFVVDVATGEERQVTDGDWHDTQPAWSPDGARLAFVSDRSERRWNQLFRSDVWIVSARGGKPRRLSRERGSAASPAFSPDGKQVAFVGNEHGDRGAGRNNALFVVPARGGAPRAAARDLDRNVSSNALPGDPFQWSPDGGSLYFLAGQRGAVPIWRVELSSGSAKPVVDGDFQAQAIELTPDGKHVVFPAVWSSSLPEIQLASLGRNPARRALSSANASLDARVLLGATERIRYRSKDGLEIEAFVLYPPGHRKGRPARSILEIHGGPHGAHPATFNMLRTQALAGAGYVVLLPNPRGSTSYGEAFERGCVGDWGGGDYEDLMAGVTALVERRVADPRQLYVSGYSYGGYMSSWVVGQTQRFRAAAIGAPITDLVSAFGTADIQHYNIESMGGTPQTSFEEYRARSPLVQLQHAKTPCLLLHWEGDLRCPIAQSEQLFTGLKLLGRDVELVRYPGGAHGIRTPSQDVDYARRELAWFAKHA